MFEEGIRSVHLACDDKTHKVDYEGYKGPKQHSRVEGRSDFWDSDNGFGA